MKKAVVLCIALVTSCNYVIAEQSQSMPTQEQALEDMFAFAPQEDQFFATAGIEQLDIPKTKRSFSFKDLSVYAQLAWSHIVNEKIKPTWFSCVAYLTQLRQKSHTIKK